MFFVLVVSRSISNIFDELTTLNHQSVGYFHCIAENWNFGRNTKANWNDLSSRVIRIVK